MLLKKNRYNALRKYKSIFWEIYWTLSFPTNLHTGAHCYSCSLSATNLDSWRSHIQSSAHVNAAPNDRNKTLMATSSRELKNNPTFRWTHSWRGYSRDAQLGLKHTSQARPEIAALAACHISCDTAFIKLRHCLLTKSGRTEAHFVA